MERLSVCNHAQSIPVTAGMMIFMIKQTPNFQFCHGSQNFLNNIMALYKTNFLSENTRIAYHPLHPLLHHVMSIIIWCNSIQLSLQEGSEQDLDVKNGVIRDTTILTCHLNFNMHYQPLHAMWITITIITTRSYGI